MRTAKQQPKPTMTANQQKLHELMQQANAAPKTEYQRVTAKAKREHWEETLWRQIQYKRTLPPIRRQATWHPIRHYTADFLIDVAALRLIIEVDGGLWQHGAHNSAYGYERDRIRDAEALLYGWTVYRVTPSMIERGEAVDYLVKICAARWHELRQKVS